MSENQNTPAIVPAPIDRSICAGADLVVTREEVTAAQSLAPEMKLEAQVRSLTQQLGLLESEDGTGLQVYCHVAQGVFERQGLSRRGG